MQVKKTNHSVTEVTITVIASADELQSLKNHVLSHFQRSAKLPGFREGKAPLALVEKNIDQGAFQTEFLEEAINQLYGQAIGAEKLRPAGYPEVNLTKFVPFSTLEFTAKVSIIGKIELPDYKKMKLARPEVKILAKDVDDVLAALRQRAAEKKEVDRAAKNSDEVVIDFSGKDSKSQAIAGADGKGYPLLLGSNSFIPGFESNLVGLKAGEEKTFDLVFPKDYGVKALANKKVTFKTKVNQVLELVEPNLDDAFAAKVGPFKTLKDLKDDIKKQVTIERQQKINLDYESDIVRKISEKTKVAIPESLIEDRITKIEEDEKQNLIYRGQTWDEHLKEEGVTAEQHRQQKRPVAEEQVKAGLVLAEIAEVEKLQISTTELEARIQALKAQYQDSNMQTELDKPEAKRDIASRMLSEKTVAVLASYMNK